MHRSCDRRACASVYRVSQNIDLRINVSDAVRIGETAEIALTVVLPDPALLAARPVVCFAKPGGGYSRGYFTCPLPGPGSGTAQAEWHARQGWIVVAIDALGVGESTIHAPEKLSYATVAAACHAAEQQVLTMLANATLTPGFPAVHDPLTIALGHSTGGALTIVQQSRHHRYDGLAILGFSAVHSHPPVPPGQTPVVVPWIARDATGKAPFPLLNEAAVAAAIEGEGAGSLWRALAWGFHYDDVPHEVVSQDLAHFERKSDNAEVGPLYPWHSATEPGAISQTCLTPGVVAPEAAAITVPVLSAMGERDVVVDPLGEPRAFRSAASIDLFICPRMAHIHNFAGTRTLLWERISQFGAWCGTVRAP